jgi:hypothetical protein
LNKECVLEEEGRQNQSKPDPKPDPKPIQTNAKAKPSKAAGVHQKPFKT